MLTAFQKHFTAIFPNLRDKRLMVAISGGLDSVVLAHLLKSSGIEIGLIHCNFNLRGAESDGDELFVKEWANDLGVKYFVSHFDTVAYAAQNGISIQMAARDLRYAFFEKIRANENYDVICTAHHLDDQLETFLINLNRGAGLDGLVGIPEKNGKIIRPLLPFSREQIQEYALENSLKWREDSSNSSNKYQRNQLRNEILPLLHKSLPVLHKHFLDTLTYLKGSQEMVGDAVARFRESAIKQTNTGIKINIAKLLNSSNQQAYLYEVIKEYGFVNMTDALALTQAETGKRVLSDTHILLRDREWLVIDKKTERETIDLEIDNIPKDYKFYNKHLSIEILDAPNALDLVRNNPSKNIHYLDGDKVEFPLRLRNWKKGDRIKPFGMNGTKLVSDVLTDAKVSFIAKEKIVVLTSKEELLWIVGVRAGSPYKVTSSTKTLIKLTYIL